MSWERLRKRVRVHFWAPKLALLRPLLLFPRLTAAPQQTQPYFASAQGLWGGGFCIFATCYANSTEVGYYRQPSQLRKTSASRPLLGLLG